MLSNMTRFLPIRLMSIAIIACLAFMGVKVNDLWHGQQYLARGFLPPAYAADAEEGGDAAEAEEEAEDETEEESAEASEEASEGEEETAPSADEAEAARLQEMGIENRNVSLSPPEGVVDVDKRYNQVELDLLQSLSERRQQIESYEQELNMREKMLGATELRIDEKIKQMEQMQAELKDLLDQNKEQEDTEMRSLVKIYESMKPKEAARIFNELNLAILLEVIDRMSERKAAPILANMNPSRAQEVTVKLAEMRQMRQKAARNAAQEVGEAQN